MVRLGRTAGALAMLLLLVSCAPREVDPNEAARARVAEAAVLERDGEWSAALAAYGRARSADPRAPLASLEAARLLERMGLLAEAVEAFEEAARRAPRSPRPRLHLAEFYRRTGRPMLAYRAIEEAERAAAREPDVLIALGRMHIERGESWKAATTLGAAVRARPEDADAYYLLGRLERQRRAFGEAETLLERAVQKDALHYPAMLELAALLGDRERSREGLRVLEKALGERPLPSPVAIEAARLHEKVGRDEEVARYRRLAEELEAREDAVQAAREALWRVPHDAAARRTLGEALLLAGRADEAEGIYRGWIHVEPESAEAWAGVLASCLLGERTACAEGAATRVFETAGDEAVANRLLEEARGWAGEAAPEVAPPAPP